MNGKTIFFSLFFFCLLAIFIFFSYFVVAGCMSAGWCALFYKRLVYYSGFIMHLLIFLFRVSLTANSTALRAKHGNKESTASFWNCGNQFCRRGYFSQLQCCCYCCWPPWNRLESHRKKHTTELGMLPLMNCAILSLCTTHFVFFFLDSVPLYKILSVFPHSLTIYMLKDNDGVFFSVWHAKEYI